MRAVIRLPTYRYTASDDEVTTTTLLHISLQNQLVSPPAQTPVLVCGAPCLPTISQHVPRHRPRRTSPRPSPAAVPHSTRLRRQGWPHALTTVVQRPHIPGSSTTTATKLTLDHVSSSNSGVVATTAPSLALHSASAAAVSLNSERTHSIAVHATLGDRASGPKRSSTPQGSVLGASTVTEAPYLGRSSHVHTTMQVTTTLPLLCTVPPTCRNELLALLAGLARPRWGRRQQAPRPVCPARCPQSRRGAPDEVQAQQVDPRCWGS